MNQLIKALKNFIIRDIIYIIGGASVILSFLYLLGKTNIISDPTSKVAYLYIAGISYVVGYCVQDTASWLGIVTTASHFTPCRIQKWFYRRFTHSPWQGIPLTRNELNQAELIIQERACADNKAGRERLISLLQVGTTIGPCGLVAGILLLIKTFIDANRASAFNIILAGSVLLTSALLIILAWIKTLQLIENTQDLYNFYRRFRENL